MHIDDEVHGHILVVDDTPINLRLMKAILNHAGYTCLLADGGEAALDAVQAGPIDLVLLDVTMPGMSGYEVCERLKQMPSAQDIPVIFLSALGEVDDKVRGFQAGGVDYITKPYQQQEVLARVAIHLRLRRLQQQLQRKNDQLEREIEERQRAEAALQRLATTDPLTNIFNRRYFFDIAAEELERSLRYHHAMALVIFDIDHFKKINDQHGHRVGDQTLEMLARVCRDNLRRVDILARYGGEEFVVLLPETGRDEALVVAERLRRVAAEMRVPIPGGEVRLTISLGLALCCQVEPVELDQLIELADRAMYQAKNSGRNRVMVFDLP